MSWRHLHFCLFPRGAWRKTRGSATPSRTHQGEGGCGSWGIWSGKRADGQPGLTCQPGRSATETPRKQNKDVVRLVHARARRRRSSSTSNLHRERAVAQRVTVRSCSEELLTRQGRALVVHRDDFRALALHGAHTGREVLHRRRRAGRRGEESDGRSTIVFLGAVEHSRKATREATGDLPIS